MICSFEESVDLPDGRYRHTKCINKAEILLINDLCYGLCFSCAYKKQKERIKELEALCFRESGVLFEALKRKDNKSMIKVVAESLKEQTLKG